MPPSVPSERLLPCLLDRLADDEPALQKESRASRVISIQRYRDAVLRDLQWLLNSKAHPEDDGTADFPNIARSVVNFGIQDLAGRVTSSFDVRDLEVEIADAIRRFEPRILPRTLVVTAVSDAGTSPNVLAFEIRGELWATPVPEQLYIKTEIDLETGECALR
jgi:type VI secretion system protein ImpF